MSIFKRKDTITAKGALLSGKKKQQEDEAKKLADELLDLLSRTAQTDFGSLKNYSYTDLKIAFSSPRANNGKKLYSRVHLPQPTMNSNYGGLPSLTRQSYSTMGTSGPWKTGERYKVKPNSYGNCPVVTYCLNNQQLSTGQVWVEITTSFVGLNRNGNVERCLSSHYINNGTNNIHLCNNSSCFGESDLEITQNVTTDNNSNSAGKAKKLDLTHLDRVVLKDDTRKEIVAVLKQHEHAGKIFDDWGLKDVIEYGRGMTFLFNGGPGTGKTWTAKLIAKALSQELLVLGAAEIQSSEPGGANRNIQNAFKSAKEENKVLFLDECDSLITNRSNVGMILGSEINTLLTEIEQFEGVLILATNRIGSLDEALARRISLIVEFADPTQPERLSIWKNLMPEKLPVDETVTLEDLSTYKLTGGQIKNAVLQAARLAVGAEAEKLNKSHFELAIKRIQESHKLFGKESRYVQVVQGDKMRSS